jgi:predicted O-methyltransferase YrrM
MHPDWQNNLHVYSEQFSSPEPPYLTDLVAFTWKKTTNPRMLSGHLQGRFLSMLISMNNPQNVLEIGSFTGYSTACLTENLHPESKITAVEADSEILFKAKSFWQNHVFMQRVNWINAAGIDFLKSTHENFDFVFIDADKRNYANYFELCSKKMIAGGIMVFDNTLWSGKVADENAIKSDTDTQTMHQFNQLLAQELNWKTLLLPIRDGLTIVRFN